MGFPHKSHPRETAVLSKHFGDAEEEALANDKVKAVTSADLSKPTPCAEFDVRSLLNHMIGGLGLLSAAAEGGTPAMPEGDQFGADPGAAYAQRRAALMAALRGDGVREHDWQMPFGTLPGETMATIAFMEHLTHGWDIAKATGQDATMPSDLVPECMDVVTAMDDMLRMPGVCGPAVSVSEDASPQDTLIAFLGRNP